MQVLSKILRDLRDGQYKTETDPLHVFIYKDNTVTSREEGDMVMARLHCVLKHWWMRGLKEEKEVQSDDNESAIKKFKKKLRWNENEKWSIRTLRMTWV
jgi:hypothetical protein